MSIRTLLIASFIHSISAGGYCHVGVDLVLPPSNTFPLTPQPASGGGLLIGVSSPLVQIPPYLMATGVKYFHPTFPVLQGSKFKLHCTCPTGCTFYIVTYHCPPCSTPIGGGWTQHVGSGWESRSCSPKVEYTNFRGQSSINPTIILRKVTNGPGTIETIPTTTYTKFVGVFAVPNDIAQPWCDNGHGYGIKGPKDCLSHCCDDSR